jgi:hypothetical protein
MMIMILDVGNNYPKAEGFLTLAELEVRLIPTGKLA